MTHREQRTLAAGYRKNTRVIRGSALTAALRAGSMHVGREVPIDVFFRHKVVGRFYADLVVDGRVLIEVKASHGIGPAYRTQLLHYLRATTIEVGLLLNFGPRPQFQRSIYSNTHKRRLGMPT